MSNIEMSDALIEATKFGDLAEVVKLLNVGADIETHNKFGSPPLVTASALGHTQIVSLLLSRGANVHVTAEENGTPLHRARNRDITWMLLACGASLETRDEFGSTPLHCAVFKPECLDVLLDWGSDIEAEDEDGYTPLWHAIDEGAEEGFATLILRGASVALMRLGTVGRKVYQNDFDIFLVLSEMMMDSPGLESALRKKRPDVFSILLEYQASNNEFRAIWARNKKIYLREAIKRSNKLSR